MLSGATPSIDCRSISAGNVMFYCAWCLGAVLRWGGDMGITKRGRKSFQTISNHRAASDRELNNDTRQPAQEDNPGTLSKHRRWQQFRSTACHLCVGIGFHWGLQNYIFRVSFLHTSLGQSRKRWSGYIVLKIKRRADILEIWGELCCCALIDVRICPLIDILQLQVPPAWQRLPSSAECSYDDCIRNEKCCCLLSRA